jgi:Tfp pilus assembly protein PilN
VNGSLNKVVVCIVFVGTLFLAAWTLDDRMQAKTMETNQRIEKVENEISQLRQMEITLARIEERLKTIEAKLDGQDRKNTSIQRR